MRIHLEWAERSRDCQDIELLIPPQKIDKKAFLTAVEGIVPKGMTPLTDDGKYAKYSYAKDPEKPLTVLAQIKPGKAEIRYMSSQGNKVIARRSITITEKSAE